MWIFSVPVTFWTTACKQSKPLSQLEGLCWVVCFFRSIAGIIGMVTHAPRGLRFVADDDETTEKETRRLERD